LNWFRLGSVASHFISFSAVMLLNSRRRMVEYVLSPNLPAATAAPKYRPDCAAAAPNVDAAACAVPANTDTNPEINKATARHTTAAVDLLAGFRSITHSLRHHCPQGRQHDGGYRIIASRQVEPSAPKVARRSTLSQRLTVIHCER
jgi:hypothetical protein